MPNCFEQEFEIFHFECDPWGRMTPGAVLRRIQEISTAHCNSLGITDAVYARTHTAFLLAKMSLQIEKMPTVEEHVRLQTRAYGMKRAVYHRVTTLYDAAGRPLCETDARWILVDTETRRILRRPLAEFEGFFADEPTEEHLLEMPKPDGPLTKMGLHAVYSLCDRNGHINNTRYADIVCDALPLEMLRAASPKKLVLNYHSEIPLDSDFALGYAQLAPNEFYFLAGGAQSKNFEAFVRF